MSIHAGNHAMTVGADRSHDETLLRLRKVSKSYPGVRALDQVDFDLRRGETHVLLGENGAGKSTLISVIAGSNRATSGVTEFRGEVVDFHSVHDARQCGIATVFQESSLVPTLSVEDNISLGVEPTRAGLLDRSGIRQRALDVLNRLRFSIQPGTIASKLSRGERQMVEIARALSAGISILILDEPTASLTDREAERLFEIIAELKDAGVGIIYITHRLREILRIGDRVTVLRDGRKIQTFSAPFREDELVTSMLGRELQHMIPAIECRRGACLFEIRKLYSNVERVRDVSLSVHAGEIVGLAGLVGSGKSAVIRAAFGLSRIEGGEVILDGVTVTARPPIKMLESGFIYLPPDRRDEGLVMMRSCRENITIAALDRPEVCRYGMLNSRSERAITDKLARDMQLHPFAPDRPVQAFSGGNQQKVMLARSLTRPAKVYAFDEPTVGVDVGTRAAIYQFIGSLCERGAAIILISSDLHEVIGLSHRAYVFYGGTVVAEASGDDLTEEKILPYFFERTTV